MLERGMAKYSPWAKRAHCLFVCLTKVTKCYWNPATRCLWLLLYPRGSELSGHKRDFTGQSMKHSLSAPLQKNCVDFALEKICPRAQEGGFFWCFFVFPTNRVDKGSRRTFLVGKKAQNLGWDNFFKIVIYS